MLLRLFPCSQWVDMNTLAIFTMWQGRNIFKDQLSDLKSFSSHIHLSVFSAFTNFWIVPSLVDQQQEKWKKLKLPFLFFIFFNLWAKLLHWGIWNTHFKPVTSNTNLPLVLLNDKWLHLEYMAPKCFTVCFSFTIHKGKSWKNNLKKKDWTYLTWLTWHVQMVSILSGKQTVLMCHVRVPVVLSQAVYW